MPKRCAHHDGRPFLKVRLWGMHQVCCLQAQISGVYTSGVPSEYNTLDDLRRSVSGGAVIHRFAKGSSPGVALTALQLQARVPSERIEVDATVTAGSQSDVLVSRVASCALHGTAYSHREGIKQAFHTG